MGTTTFMNDNYSKQFGLIIAYVLPGFITLAGLAPIFPVIGKWLWPGVSSLDLAAPVYAVLAATALGLTLSCFRWLVLDHFHRWTGIEPPTWNDQQLPAVLNGFDYVVQNHFRYYEFTGNTLIALLGTYVLNRLSDSLPFLGLLSDLVVIVIAAVLVAASRDALAKYYHRSSQLLGGIAEKE
jgi:hypothetical protein